jgi:hypothetical protein
LFLKPSTILLSLSPVLQGDKADCYEFHFVCAPHDFGQKIQTIKQLPATYSRILFSEKFDFLFLTTNAKAHSLSPF